MARQTVECVPNFSEGRDAAIVDAIVEAIASAPGASVLDRSMDTDHHRSVVTFAGPPEAVVEGAVRGAGKAAELIDLNRHQGVHPRIGALDVLPFVPLAGVTLADCVHLAGQAGEEIWRRFRVPVYLYEAAARRAERISLAALRHGQFEGLREEVRHNPDRWPDIGEMSLHPTAGAVAVGARRLLVAFNVVLNTADVEVARMIARAVRYSSGGLPFVKAMGVLLASRNAAQVSMNLTDFERMPLHRVFEAVTREAERYGVSVAASEIVGLVPKKAMDLAAGFDLRLAHFHPGMILENRLAAIE